MEGFVQIDLTEPDIEEMPLSVLWPGSVIYLTCGARVFYPTKYNEGWLCLAFLAKLRTQVKVTRRDAIVVAFRNKGLHGDALHLIWKYYVVGAR